jgi:hypothetical protein
LVIILVSLTFIIGYFFIFPFYKNLKNNKSWQTPLTHLSSIEKETSMNFFPLVFSI